MTGQFFRDGQPVSKANQLLEEGYGGDRLDQDDEFDNLMYPRNNEDYPPLDRDPFEGQQFIHVLFVCPDTGQEGGSWWGQANFFEGELPYKMQEMQQKHNERCACGGEVFVLD